MFQENLKQYVLNNSKNVAMRESLSFPGLYVLKYKKSVFYNNTWDDFLEHCRGTIVDKDFNLVSYPFQKIYNYGIEKRAPKLDANTLVTAYRKVNGFMASVTWHNGDVLVSTTGSTDSDYVTMAKEMMLKHMSWEDWTIEVCCANGLTLLFECVHPNDPHIIPEKAGMYFLGYRENSWDSEVKGFGVDVANQWSDYAKNVLNCYFPEYYVIPIQEMMEKVKNVQHEGFVFYTAENVCSKVKTPHYLTQKWVARNPNTDKLMSENIKQSIDEEYYPLIDAIRENIVEYTAMNEQDRLAWVRQFLKVE
jgi:hypothetical protein